jgi:hypothetical protein
VPPSHLHTLSLPPLCGGLSWPYRSVAPCNRAFCAAEWAAAQKSYPKDAQPKDTDLKLCFGANFAHEFLTKGLQLADDKEVTIQQEVGLGLQASYG